MRVIALSEGTEIIGFRIRANNLHKGSWTVLPHGKKVQTQDWQIPETSSCQCECNGCAKPPYTPKMKRHSLMLHKAHIMCSSKVTLRPNRSSKIVNSRAEKKEREREREKKTHNMCMSYLIFPIGYSMLVQLPLTPIMYMPAGSYLRYSDCRTKLTAPVLCRCWMFLQGAILVQNEHNK